MSATWLLFLFGLTMIAAGCNTPAWWRLTLMSFREGEGNRMGRFAITFTNLGLLVGSWIRLSAAAKEGHGILDTIPVIVGLGRDLHPIYWMAPAGTVGLGLVFIILGEILMLVASAAALKEAGRPYPCLWIFAVLAPLWALFVGVFV